MARSLRTLALIVACGVVAACAHAPPAEVASGPALPPLGEDMPDEAPAVPIKLAAIDTPVGKLCVDPAARRVVDRDLPGLTSRPEYVFFKHMSLRQLQAASRGQMSPEDLQKVAIDLGALGAPASAPLVRASAALP